MNLDSIFYPKSIAVIGASTDEGSVGSDVFKNLLNGYSGKLYPVNPRTTEVLGVKSFASVKDIPDEVELAVVIVPAAIVPKVMAEAGEKKIKGAIVISAGFKETGPEGAKLEENVKQICLNNNIVLVGPNCLGVINPEIKMNASFAGIMPAPGNVAFISQSGALCSSILDYARSLGIGFSKFISIGNKTCLDETELIQYLARDPKTKVISMYVEGLTNSQKIIKTVQGIIKSDCPKPVIMLKSGRTSAGAAASASHTGALAGDDAAYEALFKQAGIIRANTIRELFDYAIVFAGNPLLSGDRIAIVTNAGGPGVIATDELVYRGMRIAGLSPETANRLKTSLPPAASTRNPIDVLGDAKADRYKIAVEAALKDENTDGLMVVLTPQTMTEIEETARVIVDAKKESQKPIVASFIGRQTVREAAGILHEGNVANISFPDSAAKAMAVLHRFSEKTREKTGTNFIFHDIDKDKVVRIMTEAKNNNQTFFPEAEAREIIKAYGLPLLKSVRVKNADEVVKAALTFGTNLVIKIISKDIVHKVDVGGVVLNVKPAESVKKYEEMMATVAKNVPQARLEGALLTEMAPVGAGVEVVMGTKKDKVLGHMVMFGLGGIYVEIMKDVVFRLAPLTKETAYEMVKSIRAAKILEGARGMPVSDIDALVDCIGRLSALLTDFPQITELDMNPVLVLPKGEGVKVLDARILIG
jgi:acetyltransferase